MGFFYFKTQCTARSGIACEHSPRQEKVIKSESQTAAVLQGTENYTLRASNFAVAKVEHRKTKQPIVQSLIIFEAKRHRWSPRPGLSAPLLFRSSTCGERFHGSLGIRQGPEAAVARPARQGAKGVQ